MDSIKSVFTIKDFENISGIKAHTIRIWEKRYNLLQPKRSYTNIRYYTPQNLQKLLNIVFLNKNNFKISKIAKMSNEDIILNARKLALETGVNDEAINSFKLSMFKFDKALFNETYNELLLKKTFREVFKDVFIPFLEQIGLLWQTNTLLPAHEHFISNLITQKIQINTEKLENDRISSDKTYVLFLPENEIHELGLLYLNYELVLRGHHTVYLGQSLPLDNLNYFLENSKNVCYVASFTIRPYDDKLSGYFNTIDTMLKGSDHRFIAIGRKTMSMKNFQFDADIALYDGIADLLKEL